MSKFDSFELIFGQVTFNAEDMGYMKGWTVTFKYRNGVTGEYVTPKDWGRCRLMQFLVNMVEVDGSHSPTIAHLLNERNELKGNVIR